MDVADAPEHGPLSLHAQEDSELLARARNVDEKVLAIEALDRHHLRSRFMKWAVALPPLGLSLVSLYRGHLVGSLQAVFAAALVLGLLWVCGRTNATYISKLEWEVDDMTRPRTPRHDSTTESQTDRTNAAGRRLGTSCSEWLEVANAK
jgi:hypothetical protein